MSFFCGLDVISGPWNFYLRTRQHYKADKRVVISEAVSDSDEELYLVDASTHILDFGRLSPVQSSHFGTECPTLCAKTTNTIIGGANLEYPQFLTLETVRMPDSIGQDAFSEVKW